jgi:YD repeat-containing protein
MSASFPMHFSVPTSGTQYDETKNRVSQTYNSQPMPADAYDAAGNATNHPYVGVMTYDGQKRLVRYVGNGKTVTFSYDAEGRRVKKEESAGGLHLFRHTMATLMLEGGADIRFIQAMLGRQRRSTRTWRSGSFRRSTARRIRPSWSGLGASCQTH